MTRRRLQRLLLLPLLCAAGARGDVSLLDAWFLGTNQTAGGAVLSQPTYVPSSPAWAPVVVPCTVLACLQQQGLYPNLYVGDAISQVPTGQFNASWWYATRIPAPAAAAAGGGGVRSLRFKGLSYRANIWVNGVLVADNATAVGTFRYFDVPLPATGAAGVAVEVFRPFDRALPASNRDLDLALTFVDWAPTPPDGSMGLWREVELRSHPGPVGLLDPGVLTTLPPPSAGPGPAGGAPPAAFEYADLTVVVTARNWDATAPAVGAVTARILAPDGATALATACAVVTLPPGAELRVALPPARVATPDLWWPWQMGNATLHFANVSFALAPGGCSGGADPAATSDSVVARFGIRTASSALDANGNRLFRVNGVPLLVRGGGWSPDLLLRPDPARLAAQLAMTRHMGLNAIRLEGKLEPDAFFDGLDELGLLALPGWCCCDAWQHWPWWGPEQLAVAGSSLRSQLRRLLTHPSVLTFFISSDELPPPGVEALYLNVSAEEGWPAFAGTVSAASARVSNLTGPTGVKMSGPYSWVPPSYWLLDTQNGTGLGGAWGFLTEGGPGENPLPPEALAAVLPNASWPPPANDTCWGHCGSPLGMFGGLGRFNAPLAARYGAPGSLREYLALSQLAAAESHKAFVEGYSVNKYAPATGFIQWMLNDAWPSNIWHLFPYDLSETSTYYAARTAQAGVHVAVAPASGALWAVNSGYAPAPPADTVLAVALFAPNGTDLTGGRALEAAIPAGCLPADGAVRLPAPALPPPAAIQAALGPGQRTYLVRLQLADAATGAVLHTNVVALSTTPDTLDWAASTWYVTPCSAYADLTGLRAAPAAPRLAVAAAFAPAVDFGALGANDAATLRWLAAQAAAQDGGVLQQATVTLTHPGGPGAAPAHAVRVRLLNGTAAGAPAPVLPVLWSDNFVTLRAGATATLTGVFRAPPGSDPAAALAVAWDCFNCS